MSGHVLRSLLFVPGDSERKQAKALGSGADALILDLEDSVDVSQLPVARTRVHDFVSSARTPDSPQLWVRVNSLGSGKMLEDLVAVIGARPDGVVLPKVSSVRELVEVGHYLSALEAREGLAEGSTRVVVIATETPAALLSLGEYRPETAGKRLAGLPNVHLREVGNREFLSSFRAGTMDVVFSFLVLQHMEREDAFLYLRDAHRVLKPGGRLFTQFPNLLSPVYTRAHLENVEAFPRSDGRVRAYTEAEVRHVLALAGFEITELWPGGHEDLPAELYVAAVRR